MKCGWSATLLRRKTRGRRRKRLARNWNGALCLCSSWWKSILAFCCLLSFCYSAFLCVCLPRPAGDGGAARLKTASVKIQTWKIKLARHRCCMNCFISALGTEFHDGRKYINLVRTVDPTSDAKTSAAFKSTSASPSSLIPVSFLCWFSGGKRDRKWLSRSSNGLLIQTLNLHLRQRRWGFHKSESVLISL